MNVDGRDSVFRGSIGPFSVDNLGSHLLCGFTQRFSSLRICRVCMATSDDIQPYGMSTGFLYELL